MTLKDARTRQGLSQVELAARVGRTPQFISFLESGRTKQPTYVDVVNIAKALNCDPADLSFTAPRKRRIAKRAEQDTRRSEVGR